MRTAMLLSLLALFAAVPAVAQDAAPAKADEAKPAEAKPAAPAVDMTKIGPMTRPIKAPKKLMREVRAFLKKEDQAMKKHDLAASMALIDFPVWMATDDAKGEGSGEKVTKEAFEAMMKPFFEQPTPKGMKMTRKNAITLLSPSLALVVSTWKMRMGKMRGTFKNAELLVKKGGQWKSQVMIEAGWGDMPSGPPAGE
jgi:hypothetical protein